MEMICAGYSIAKANTTLCVVVLNSMQMKESSIEKQSKSKTDSHFNGKIHEKNPYGFNGFCVFLDFSHTDVYTFHTESN